MENKGEIVEGEHHLVEVAAEGGALKLESVDGVGDDSLDSNEGLKDSEENEVFDEALEALPYDGLSTSEIDASDGREKGEDRTFEDEKFVESIDMQVVDQSAEVPETATEQLDILADYQDSNQTDEDSDALVDENPDVYIDAELNNSAGRGKEDSEGMNETVTEGREDEKKEIFPADSNGVEAEGVTEDGVGDVEGSSSVVDDGEVILMDHAKQIVSEKTEAPLAIDPTVQEGDIQKVDIVPIESNGMETDGLAESGIRDVVDNPSIVNNIVVVPPDYTEQSVAEKIEALDVLDHTVQKEPEYAKEVLLAELNGGELDGVTEDGKDTVESSAVVNDGKVIPGDGANQSISEKTEDGDPQNTVKSNGMHTVVQEEPENGEAVKVNYDKFGLYHGTASKNDISYDDKAQQTKNDSVNQAELTDKVVNNDDNKTGPHDNGLTTDTGATVITDDRSAGILMTSSEGQEHPNEGRAEDSGINNRIADILQFEDESVLVEEVGDSSSSDDDDNKTPSTLPASSAASHSESSGGPVLASRPAGLGTSAPLLEPSARSLQQPKPNGSVSHRQSQPSEEPSNDDAEENDEIREKLQMIRVKFLRLAHRLGQTPHNVVVAQVLYRLGLAEQLRRNTTRPGVFSFDRASVMAEQLEAGGQEPLDFSCTIMVIGKTGVGKSATINSIFDEAKLRTDAFQVGTKKVQEIVGKVQGIKVRVIDTPGLFSSSSDQRHNEKILQSVKRFINKTPPDIVLYFDRLDMQSRDYGDVPLLRTITDIFGASIWFNAIVVLTHAASAPPDGPNGIPLSYEMFVTQRSHVVQQAIRQAAGDLRLMNPVSLVENHSACRMNRAGQRVLPNGQVWKPQLLLLSFASKILAEANMLLKLQDSPPGKPFGRVRVPPLPFFLSSLLQSRPQLKLPEDQFGDGDPLEEDLGEASDSDDGSDYDELPPFKSLTKSQLAKLSRAQKKAYYEELDYREKLFYKKQLKEEKRRRKFMKKMVAEAKDLPNDYTNENVEDENSGPASVPVPMPDLVLPTSFDSDNPTHRYRFLDSSNQWLVRPVLETQGWDHDVGYEGLNVERLFIVKDKIPLSVSGQLTKDKKECTLQMELASSIKHSEGTATSLGVDVQTVGKDTAYTLRGETRFNNFKRNNTAAGLSVTLLGDSISAGLKMEDKLIISRQFRLLASGGAMTGRGDVAYGGRLEATLRDKDYPLGRMLLTLALSVVDWHGDLAVGCNIQSQFPVGRGTNVIGHANLSNKGTGQVGIRLNSSDQLQMALIALVPIFRNIKRVLFNSSEFM
ncbi:translocase of chloroplast 101, chloroplastic-like [Typha latifolia]|uniref:translocase of chloroplast 101, chloroplastic-like n=1 Tax=Typha latifolia TaxID=4733 RepID=UPI003C2D65BF